MTSDARSSEERIASLTALRDERVRLYEGMNKISMILLSSFSLEENLPHILKEATCLFGNESSAISLQEHGGFTVQFAEGFPNSPLGSRMVPEEEPHARLALAKREAQFIEDAWTDERTNHGHMHKWNIRAVIVIPLVVGERELGVVFLNWHKDPVKFDELVRDAVARFSTMLSLSLANAELIQERDRELAQRKRTEEAVRLSEEKYAIAFESNPAVISVTRLEDGVYLEVNDTWVAMTGYMREEVIGHSARKMPIWPSQGDVARFVQEIRERGFVRGREQEFRKKSGEPFLVEMSSQLLTIQGDKVILSTMVDITERKKVEVALRVSEALAKTRLEELEAVYKTAPVGLCLLDRDLRWVKINDTLAEANGFPVEAHLGKTPWELIPDFGPQAEAAMRRVLETGEPLLNIEFTGTTPSRPGVVRSFNERWLPWRDQQGNILGISVAAEETTERKRMEAALLSSEENLRLMVNEASEAMVVLDAGGVIQAVSHLGAQLLGYEEGDLIGNHAERFAETFSRLEVALKLEDLRTHAPRPVTTSVYVRAKTGAVQLLSLRVRSVGIGTKAEKYFVKFTPVDLPLARSTVVK